MHLSEFFFSPFSLLSSLLSLRAHRHWSRSISLPNVGKPFNDEEASIRKREKSRYAPSMKNCKSDRSFIISCYICPFTITLPESDANVEGQIDKQFPTKAVRQATELGNVKMPFGCEKIVL
jgi:hypothetical protein